MYTLIQPPPNPLLMSSRVPCALRSLLVIHFRYSGVSVSIPNSLTIPSRMLLLSCPAPPCSLKFVLYVGESLVFFVSSFVSFLFRFCKDILVLLDFKMTLQNLGKYFPILQVKKLRHKEMKELDRGSSRAGSPGQFGPRTLLRGEEQLVE